MSKKGDIMNFVGRKMKYFSETSDYSASKAEFAVLRRGVGHSPGELPELYGAILKDMPESLWNDHGETTIAEWCCYIALTLYALHQQGRDVKVSNMHTDKRTSIGDALRRLTKKLGDVNAEERNLKKLQMLITSVDMREFSYHLKGIITLLRSEGIALNYVELARDIYEFQFADTKTRVSLRWGQDYYRRNEQEDDENE